MSDNELDAELLALAGGDGSSSEEEEDIKTITPRKRSPQRQRSRSAERSPPRRGTAQKLKSRANSKKIRKDESDEEGEASEASSPSSLGSAAMDESQSEGMPDTFDDDAPLYPLEGQFSSERDKAEIMAMTEIQREQVLADRAEEARRRTQDQQLKRLLQNQRKVDAGNDAKKRKAGAADLDDGQRKSSRQKTKEKSSTLDAYKKQRELKGAQRLRGEERKRDERSPSEVAALSDKDADGESEVEWDDGGKASAPREEPALGVRDFERIRIGRTNFSKVCFYPTFEPLIKGCYCRVSVGMEAGQSYRMTQVKGFKDGRPYIMEGPNGKKVYTDQYVILAHGKTEKEYPFQACSDGKFTDAEFDEFKRALSEGAIRFPNKSQVLAKLNDIHALLDHQWTEADIQSKIDKAHKMQQKHHNYGRDRIVRRRDEAASRGEDLVVARCNQELAAYETGGSTKPKTNGPSKAIQQQERLAALNRANRKANSEEVRKAQLAEKRAIQKAREEAIAKARKAEADAKAKSLRVPGKDVDDLFGDGSDISRAGTPANGVGTPKSISRAGTPLNGVKEKRPFGTLRKKNMDDEIIAGMDLGIEIDI